MKAEKWVLMGNNGEVKTGQKVMSFRGELATVTAWDAPHKEGSTGRVYVLEDGALTPHSYFPAVFGLKFVKTVVDA